MMENRIDLTLLLDLARRTRLLRHREPSALAEYSAFFNLSRLGHCGERADPQTKEGNPPPRIAETPAGILNSVGLQNPGVHAFIRDEYRSCAGMKPR